MTSSSGSLRPRVPPTPMAPLGYAKPGKRLPLPDRRGQGHAEGLRVKAGLTEVHRQEAEPREFGSVAANPRPVMAGLVPAIHVFRVELKFVDARDFARA